MSAVRRWCRACARAVGLAVAVAYEPVCHLTGIPHVEGLGQSLGAMLVHLED